MAGSVSWDGMGFLRWDRIRGMGSSSGDETGLGEWGLEH